MGQSLCCLKNKDIVSVDTTFVLSKEDEVALHRISEALQGIIDGLDGDIRGALWHHIGQTRPDRYDFPGGSRGAMERNFCYIRAIPSVVQRKFEIFAERVDMAVQKFDYSIAKGFREAGIPRRMMTDIKTVDLHGCNDFFKIMQTALDPLRWRDDVGQLLPRESRDGDASRVLRAVAEEFLAEGDYGHLQLSRRLTVYDMCHEDVRSELNKIDNGWNRHQDYRKLLEHRLTVTEKLPALGGPIGGVSLCCFAADALYAYFQTPLQLASLRFVSYDIARLASFPALEDDKADHVEALQNAVASVDILFRLTRGSHVKFSSFHALCDYAFILDTIKEESKEFWMESSHTPVVTP